MIFITYPHSKLAYFSYPSRRMNGKIAYLWSLKFIHQMKQIIAVLLSILLLGGSLLPKVDAFQLAKVGELVKHYKEHRRTEKTNLSFMAFLQMHYSATSKHTKTAKHSHAQLPSFDSQVGNVFLPSFQSISLVFKPIVMPFVASTFNWQNFYHFALVASFLNPPRI
jgi:hypothetical protein